MSNYKPTYDELDAGLTKTLKTLKRVDDGWKEKCKHLSDAVERLRASLQSIVDSDQVREFMGNDAADGYGSEGWVTRDGRLAKLARAALAEQQQTAGERT